MMNINGWSLSVLLAFALPAGAEVSIPEAYRVNGFAIGAQAWSFNSFTAFEAIEKCAEAGGKVIEFFPGQKISADLPDAKMEPGLTDAQIAKVKEKLAQHKMMAANFGVTGISKNEAEARKLFEFAKKMGFRALTTESADAINTIEKMVKEYDILVGFHNHAGSLANPGYKVWHPLYIAGLIEGRDPRIGAAADTGHWARAGINPLEGLKALKGRLISVHLKDLNEFGKVEAHDVHYGTGVCNAKALLDELVAQKFQGNIAVEYEHNWGKNVPDIAACIQFVAQYKK